MASKQILKSLKVNSNFCEINPEYPSLNVKLMERHLCTNIKPLKTAQSSGINKILNTTTTTDQHEKNPKNTEKETEVIDLFQYQQEEEEIHNNKNKLYRKCRYQLTNSNNDEETRDNTN